MANELIIQGSATDDIWAMAAPDGTINLYLDPGEAGRSRSLKRKPAL